MRAIFLACLLLALPAAAAPPPAFAPAADSVRTIYRGATLVDPVAGTATPDMAIVVQGQTIRGVMPVAQLPAPGDAQIVDVSGSFVLPALIDSHVHLRTPDRPVGEIILRRSVYSGIAAVRDMGDDLGVAAGLARDALSGQIASPDIYTAAMLAGPKFFESPKTRSLWGDLPPGTAPWAQAVTDSTDLAEAVRKAHATGAIAVKVYSDMAAPLVRRIIAEARRQNMLVWAHGAIFPATPRELIDAGPDVLSHVCHLAYQVSDKFPASNTDRPPVDYAKFAGGDNPVLGELFADMQRRGIVLDATLSIYVRSGPSLVAPQCTEELAVQLTRQAHRAGVQIAAGTDRLGSLTEPFPPLYAELELLADKAGLRPAEVLRAATSIGALAAGQKEQMGTIEPGKLANLMFVTANPLDDIRNLRTVTLTVKRGVRFPRADFQPAAK